MWTADYPYRHVYHQNLFSFQKRDGFGQTLARAMLWSLVLPHAADSPGASDEVNRPISLDGKRCLQMVSQRKSLFWRKRPDIERRWPLPSEKWGPVIVEIVEDGGNSNWANFHLPKLSSLEQVTERLRLTKWETLLFVERACSWVNRHDSIPEGAN